jgi:glutamine amidotransferase
MITIIDTGVGNLASIRNMLRRADAESKISTKVEDLAAAEKLILPGIGAFDAGMARLRELGVVDVLRARVVEAKVPLLGICLGAQLLFEGSDEGNAPGLALLRGRVVKFDRARLGATARVPHMGWTDVVLAKPSALFEGMYQEPRFYFVHSFHFAPDDPTDVLCTAEHGYVFPAAVERGNIFGVQFHPEKSHKFGLKLLESFARLPT